MRVPINFMVLASPGVPIENCLRDFLSFLTPLGLLLHGKKTVV
jgi:hypothetical protein